MGFLIFSAQTHRPRDCQDPASAKTDGELKVFKRGNMKNMHVGGPRGLALRNLGIDLASLELRSFFDEKMNL